MNYIGSKLSLLEFIENSITKVAGDVENCIFCDLFAGTGAVGLHFKKLGCKVISNDIQYYSFVLNRHYIGNHKPLLFENLFEIIPQLELVPIDERKSIVCNFLNSIDEYEGFIYKNYCPNDKSERQYFTKENGKMCDAIREKIEIWYDENKINGDEYFFLLATLLENIDKKANTASVYGAYLKGYKNSAKQNLQYQPLPLFINDKEHEIYNTDANELINSIKPDIIYLDPPYNARQYATNYHILETIAKNDNPQISGKTGLRNYSKQKSKYCFKATVKKEFAELIKNAKAKYIFLSYNNEGLLSFDDIKEIMSSRGEYGFFERSYSRFKADNNREYKTNFTTEYLHYVKVR